MGVVVFDESSDGGANDLVGTALSERLRGRPLRGGTALSGGGLVSTGVRALRKSV